MTDRTRVPLTLDSFMPWKITFYDEFENEVARLPKAVQKKLAQVLKKLSGYGPFLGRPHAETLKGSKFANMKELRFKSENREWRVAYIFDTDRKALLLVAGSKSGVNQRQFYSKLVTVADQRYQNYLLKSV